MRGGAIRIVAMSECHAQPHRIHRSGQLRAAVLGANDGIVSTSSLIVGVAASGATLTDIIIAGVAGLVAGAISMAAGEYVSVKSQEDIERADLAMEARSLHENPEGEWRELSEIYQARGLDKSLADEVAHQLMNHNALEAHARDDIGISMELSARPLQAAFWSAVAFTLGGVVPVLSVELIPQKNLLWALPIITLLLLGFLGGLAAKVGGANVLKAGIRVMFWGMLAMGITAAVGKAMGVTL